MAEYKYNAERFTFELTTTLMGLSKIRECIEADIKPLQRGLDDTRESVGEFVKACVCEESKRVEDNLSGKRVKFKSRTNPQYTLWKKKNIIKRLLTKPPEKITTEVVEEELERDAVEKKKRERMGYYLKEFLPAALEEAYGGVAYTEFVNYDCSGRTTFSDLLVRHFLLPEECSHFGYTTLEVRLKQTNEWAELSSLYEYLNYTNTITHNLLTIKDSVGSSDCVFLTQEESDLLQEAKRVVEAKEKVDNNG